MLSIRCNDCDKEVNPTKESGSTGMVVDHPTHIYLHLDFGNTKDIAGQSVTGIVDPLEL